MRINGKTAAGLLIIVGAVLGTILGTSLAGTSTGSGAGQYEVTVRFNRSVTQDDIEEADAFLRTFDDDLDFLIMEMYPPIGRAVMAAEASRFCETVEEELGGRSYVDDVSCQPWERDSGGDPDIPVSTDSDMTPQEAR
jgi:hypothetical protein